MTEGLALAAIGLAVGMIAAASLSRLIAKLRFGVQPYDGVPFATAALILAAVAAAASFAPARRYE